ncbi:MAG: division/cell wall cluster transcriptional repressor MraZ [Gammaproteobacteria bacterium]|nr:division/cell wall cluster transcriptional repressor MraZ [Gammaproteobacteria bacterium]
MFRGLSSGQIDSKGRITIPANYRTLLVEESSGSLVVTIDTQQKCLLLYPFPQWQIIEEKLESLPSFQPAARRIQRLLLGHATELELDRQGRILLPNLLRDHAELDETVMLVGLGKKIEIWSEPLWEDARATWLAECMDENEGVPMELAMMSL